MSRGPIGDLSTLDLLNVGLRASFGAGMMTATRCLLTAKDLSDSMLSLNIDALVKSLECSL